jgi:hypothetical protein
MSMPVPAIVAICEKIVMTSSKYVVQADYFLLYLLLKCALAHIRNYFQWQPRGL